MYRALFFAAFVVGLLPAALAAQELAMPAAPGPRNLDTFHMPVMPATRRDWVARRQALRRQILVGAGLWPTPPRCALEPVVTGRIEGPDFIVENVAIQTVPGFYLCGNLYRPRDGRGPFPAIANPHGHWTDGRRTMEPDVPAAEPPPAPPAPGKGNLVSIGVNLARQGFVVFAYDMVGYNDTNQADHGYAGSLEHWQWGVSLLGLQLWNSIRVVDYLQSRPDVDRRRIGATGGSGGGTQTFLLAAVDDRVKVSVPVNMVSASMQGGCLCENGPGLRLGTDNVEISAMCAPRPQLLVNCTGDWTRNVPRAEWPAVRAVYSLYGAEDRTAAVQFNYQHNYNMESREAMYAWFGRWLKDDPDPSRYRERPFAVDPAQLRVWNDTHRRPSALTGAELTRLLKDQARQAVDARMAEGPGAVERTYGPALAAALGYVPEGAPSRRSARPVTVVVHTPDDRERALAARDALPGQRATMLALNPVRGAAGDLWAAFFSTYNRTPVGDRVASIAAALRKAGPGTRLVGIGEAGPWCLLARAVAAVSGGTVADADRFDPADEKAFAARLYAPCLRRVGDLRSALVLAAMRGPVWVHNTGGMWPDAAAAACAQRLGNPVEVRDAPAGAREGADWLDRR